MPNMTGRPGYRTMEMNGGSSAPYLACIPCVPLYCTSFNRGGNRIAFRLPGARGVSFPLYGGTFARSCSVSRNGHLKAKSASSMAKLVLPLKYQPAKIISGNSRRGHWKRGVCIKLSEINFQVRDKSATVVRTLPLMYEMKYHHFFSHIWRAICHKFRAIPPL